MGRLGNDVLLRGIARFGALHAASVRGQRSVEREFGKLLEYDSKRHLLQEDVQQRISFGIARAGSDDSADEVSDGRTRFG